MGYQKLGIHCELVDQIDLLLELFFNSSFLIIWYNKLLEGKADNVVVRCCKRRKDSKKFGSNQLNTRSSVVHRRRKRGLSLSLRM